MAPSNRKQFASRFDFDYNPHVSHPRTENVASCAKLKALELSGV